MKVHRMFLWFSILALTACLANAALAAGEVVRGTVTSVAGDTSLSVQTETNSITVKLCAAAEVLRGQVGRDMREVPVREIAPGDMVVATLSENGCADSVRAYFGIIKGTFAKLQGEALVLKDGRSVPLSPNAQVVLADGRSGQASELKPGSLLLCRVSPVDTAAWMVLVITLTKPTLPKPVAIAPTPAPAKPAPKPVISSVTYSAPVPLRVGDLITVDIAGTPGGEASFEINGLLVRSPAKEITPGAYHAVLPVPKAKSVQNAALVGYLSVNGSRAVPVQASRLISVGTATPAVAPPPAPVEAPKPVPVATPEKKPESRPEQKLGRAAITLLLPPDGAVIRKAIVVKGKAEADAKVMVEVTYNNGLTGLLKLSGRVASQSVATGKSGEFTVGPVALEGPLATQGLQFTVKAYYPEGSDHATAVARVTGDRN